MWFTRYWHHLCGDHRSTSSFVEWSFALYLSFVVWNHNFILVPTIELWVSCSFIRWHWIQWYDAVGQVLSNKWFCSTKMDLCFCTVQKIDNKHKTPKKVLISRCQTLARAVDKQNPFMLGAAWRSIVHTNYIFCRARFEPWRIGGDVKITLCFEWKPFAGRPPFDE